jgi:hypothetical protein
MTLRPEGIDGMSVRAFRIGGVQALRAQGSPVLLDMLPCFVSVVLTRGCPTACAIPAGPNEVLAGASK